MQTYDYQLFTIFFGMKMNLLPAIRLSVPGMKYEKR